MPFLLLICLMAVCRPIDWPESRFGGGSAESIATTAMTTVGLPLAAAWLSRHTAHALIHYPDRRESIAHRYGLARTYLFFANLFGFAFCLLVLGWGDTAQRLCAINFHGNKTLAPGVELLILAPFLIAQIGSWFFYYDADREFNARGPASSAADPFGRDRYGHFWSRRGYVLFMFRQQLIVVFAPLLFMMTEQAIERLYPEINNEPWLPLAAIGTMLAFFLVFPLFFPILLGLKPLPRGPIRDRLERDSRRLRFRYAQIYLWDTRGAMANAMVVGIIPRLRFVVFTDRLLEELTDDETDAVFGHEVGHAHYGHMLYYAVFLILSLFLISAVLQSFGDDAVQIRFQTLGLVAEVAMMGVYMFSVFGFISRRCERQADIFGCRAVSCLNDPCQGHYLETPLPEGGKGLCTTGITAFIRALRRVEEVNGMARPTPVWEGAGLPGKLNWIFRMLTGWLHTWQHSTISRRVAFLQRMAADPGIEGRFQIRVWILKWAVIGVLLGSLAAIGFLKGWNFLLPLM